MVVWTFIKKLTCPGFAIVGLAIGASAQGGGPGGGGSLPSCPGCAGSGGVQLMSLPGGGLVSISGGGLVSISVSIGSGACTEFITSEGDFCISTSKCSPTIYRAWAGGTPGNDDNSACVVINGETLCLPSGAPYSAASGATTADLGKTMSCGETYTWSLTIDGVTAAATGICSACDDV